MSTRIPNSIVRAGKAHVCEACDTAIRKGEDCLRTCEGGFTTWRHITCALNLKNARGELVHDCAGLRARKDFSSVAPSDHGTGEKAAPAVDPLDGKHRVLPPFVCHTDGGASESYAQLAARVLVANETY